MAKRNERGLPPENTSVSRQKAARPSGHVAGDMKIVSPISERCNRSAAHYADAMKPLGGSDGGTHKYDKKTGDK